MIKYQIHGNIFVLYQCLTKGLKIPVALEERAQSDKVSKECQGRVICLASLGRTFANLGVVKCPVEVFVRDH